MEEKLKKIYDLYIKRGLLTAEATPFDKWVEADEEQQIKLFELGQKEGLFGEDTGVESFTALWGLKKKDESDVTSQEDVTVSTTEEVQEAPGSSESLDPNFSTLPGGQQQETETTETEVVETPRTTDIREQIRRGSPNIAEKDTWLEESLGKNIATNWVGDIWRSAKFGYTQGAGADEALEIAAKGTGSSDKDIAEFIAAQEKLAGLGQTDEMRKFDKDMAAAGGGVLGFLKSLVKNDGIIPQLAVQTMTQLLNPASLAAAGTTIAAGAGLGATTGSVGGPVGGAAGALLGGAASLPWAYATAGATLETAMSFAEFMQEEVAKKGLKFDNEGVRAVLEDDDAMFNIRAKSLGRGGIIGIVDRISVGLGGKLIKGMKLATPKGKVAQKVMHSKLGQVGAAAGTEAVGGGTGEALARLGVGQEMDVKEIGFEAIGGIGRTPFTYAYGQVMSKPKYTIKNKIGEEEAIDQQEVARIIKESSDKDFAAMNLEIVNDPLLKAEAQKRKADLREESAILKELYDAGVTDPDLVAELVILEQSKKKLEGNETTAAKQRLQEIEQQISDLLTGKRIPPKKDSKEDELATQETIEAQREEELEEHRDKFFTEDKETGNRVGPNPDTQPELYNEEIKERDAINKKYDELLTEKNKKEEVSTKEDELATQDSDSVKRETYETINDDGNKVIVEVTTAKDGSRTVRYKDAEGTTYHTSTFAKDNTLTNEKIIELNVAEEGADITNTETIEGFENLHSKKQVESRRKKLLTEKNKKDAIQEQSTTTMDVQEQTQDGRKVGERDAPVDEVTRESETEIETDTQTPTQEEVIEESRDLESIIKGTPVAPKGEPVSVTQEEVVEEEVTTPMEADVVENTQEKTVKVPHAKTKKKVTLAGKKSKVSPNVFIVEESVEAVDPIYKNKEAQAKQESLIIRAVEKAGKAIRKILGTKIILHRTEASYNKATGQNSKGSQGKAGSRGMYNASNNVIHINMPHAKQRTVAHEIFHALVMSKFKSAKLKALTDRMVAAVRKEITDPALQKKLDKFIALNKKLDPEYAAKFEAEEYLAELTGILAENYNKLPAKAQNIIQRWVKKIQKIIADATGYKTQITSPLEILNVFAQRISEGKEISEETVSQFEKIAKKKPAKKKKTKEGYEILEERVEGGVTIQTIDPMATKGKKSKQDDKQIVKPKKKGTPIVPGHHISLLNTLLKLAGYKGTMSATEHAALRKTPEGRALDKLITKLLKESKTYEEAVEKLTTVQLPFGMGSEAVAAMKDYQASREIFTDEQRAEAHEQRQAELEKEMQQESGIKGQVSYIQQQIHEYFGGITRQDFDQYGDPNWRGRAINFLLRKEASPLDGQAQELSEMAGVEITEQDFIDYMMDRVNNPGKYAQSRTQLMDLTPKQKVIQIAERHGIKANGFFPANLWDPTGLRKQLSKEGYGLVESRIREGYRAGEVAGYYISKPGGGKFNLPASDRFQMLFNKDDSPTDIINKARELGFKDEAIKDYLQRVEKLAAKEVKALLQSPTPQQQTIPVAFGNVEGGMVVGEKIYNEINAQIEVFKKENNPNNAELRAEGLRLLEQNESFKKQPKITQKELISAYDRSLQTTANKEVQKKIGAIRKELGAYKKGKTDLEKIKGKVSQFIRQALPVDKDTPYTKADVIALMNAVAKATDKTLLTTIDRVVQRVDKIRDAATKKEIAKIRTLVDKKAQTRKTESKKRRGKGLDAAGQQFFRSVKNILNLAIKGDIVALEQIRESLEAAEVIIGQGKDAVVVDTQEMLGKELRGEELTTKEQQVLEQLYALDTFGDIANMSLEDVKNLYQGLKDVRAESIKRLGINRLRRAEQRAKLDEKADEEVKENYPFLFHEDGTLKSKNDLDQDARGVWNDFQNLRIWSSLKKFVNRYEFTSGIGIADFFRKRIQHLGTLMNLIDNVAKNNYFFTENVYNRLNRMESRYLEGEQRETDSKESGLSKIAESMGIKGTKLRSAYSKWKSQIPQGARDLIVKGRKVSLTIDEMMRIYALSKNDVQRAKLEAMGYDQSILEEIERTITPTATEFIDKVVEYLSNDYFESVNSVYRQVNDVNLGYVENYFPTRTIAPNVDGMITDIEGANFSGIFNAEYSSAFKERVDKTSEIDLGAGFTSVLETHIRSMERFKAFAQDTQILNNIFKNKAINTLITELGTKQTMKNLINLTINPNSGLKQEKVLVEKVLSKFTSFALAFKFMQIPKQATSFVNAYEEYSFRGKGKQTPGLDTIGFMLDIAWVIATLPYQVKKAWSISPDFRNRLKKGLEGDIYGLETGSRTFKPITKGLTKVAKIKKAFKKVAGSPTILGDVMGVMGYMANYNANIRSGMSKAEAVQTFANYNATQQSRRNTDKNTLQLSGTELTRVFTMFGSTLFLQMNKVMSGTTNIMRSLKAKKAPRLKDTRALALNFAIANMLFVATANMFKLIDDDEDREEAMKKIKDAGMGLNLLYQIPLFGGASEMIIRSIQGDRGKADDVVNPFKAIWWKINRAMKEDTKWKTFLPVFELIIGAQMDPFIGLAKYFAGEGDEMENVYDMLGVSPSYQPNEMKKSKSKSKSTKGDPRKTINVRGGGVRSKDIRQKANVRE